MQGRHYNKQTKNPPHIPILKSDPQRKHQQQKSEKEDPKETENQ